MYQVFSLETLSLTVGILNSSMLDLESRNKTEKIPELLAPFIINSFLSQKSSSLWSKFLFHQAACLHVLLQLLSAAEANCRESTTPRQLHHVFLSNKVKNKPIPAFLSVCHPSLEEKKNLSYQQELSQEVTCSTCLSPLLQNITALHQYCITQKHHSETGIKVDACFSSSMGTLVMVINIQGRNIL